MIISSNLKKTLLGAGISVALFAAGPAFAGQCPAGKMKAGARTSGEMAPIGVTDTELNVVDLGPEISGLDGRRLRLRRLVVQPGGVVPWHDHADRPALIMTQEGEITEFRSDCSVGIVHKAGEVSKESEGVMHWWKNESAKPTVLIATDIKNDNVPVKSDNM
ncbi:MAG: cupin [Parvularculaceae bacterium]